MGNLLNCFVCLFVFYYHNDSGILIPFDRQETTSFLSFYKHFACVIISQFTLRLRTLALDTFLRYRLISADMPYVKNFFHL